jgi:acyl-CoA reductase-like NAD-dependent aldehyde dehydrogenase
MFADGVLHPSRDTLAVINPWTQEVVGQVPDDDPAEVAAAVEAVAAAWQPLPPQRRASVLRHAAAELTRHADAFADRITREAGVCRKEAAREVTRAADNLLVAAEEAGRLRGESFQIPGHDRLAITVPEPIGVLAGITPFNRPLNQIVVKAAPAIAAGCAVVLKPSEKAPLSAIAAAELLVEAGFPKQMLAVTTGQPARVGGALASHPAVDMVAFTGSVATGRTVAAAAAGKKQLLELGGNDPLIVLADADLELAVRLAADGAYATAGQSCRGVKRIIIHEQVADAFLALLVAATRAKRHGDPSDPATDVGPLISEEAAKLVESRIQAALRDGARLVHGGQRQGPLITSTVLDHVPPGTELVREETLGPVAPIIRARTLDEVVAYANCTRYGLQAGVVTRDLEAFWRLAAELRVGAVNLAAGPHFDSPHIPFGGVKASGIGREGMRYAIQEMTATKTVTVPYRPGPMQPGPL